MRDPDRRRRTRTKSRCDAVYQCAIDSALTGAHWQGGVRYHRVERSEGSFRRTVALPEGVDPTAIECTFKDGVLAVRVPKPANDKRNDEHTIEIKQ